MIFSFVGSVWSKEGPQSAFVQGRNNVCSIRHAVQVRRSRTKSRILATTRLLIESLDPHQRSFLPTSAEIRELTENLHLLHRHEQDVVRAILRYRKVSRLQFILELLLRGFHATYDQIRFLWNHLTELSHYEQRVAKEVFAWRQDVAIALL